jgi:hypothetical protein
MRAILRVLGKSWPYCCSDFHALMRDPRQASAGGVDIGNCFQIPDNCHVILDGISKPP